MLWFAWQADTPAPAAPEGVLKRLDEVRASCLYESNLAQKQKRGARANSQLMCQPMHAPLPLLHSTRPLGFPSPHRPQLSTAARPSLPLPLCGNTGTKGACLSSIIICGHPGTNQFCLAPLLRPAPPDPVSGAQPQVSTRILGRRTAPFPPFLIPHRVPHGFTQDPSTDRPPRAHTPEHIARATRAKTRCSSMHRG